MKPGLQPGVSSKGQLPTPAPPPGAPETPKEGDPPKTPDPPATPQVVTITRNGKQVDLTMEQAQQYASQGVDYSDKMRAMKDERNQNTEALGFGQELMAVRDRDPEAAKRIIAIARGQETPAATSVPTPVAGQLDDEAMSDTEKLLLQQNREMRGQLEQQTQTLNGLAGRLDEQQTTSAAKDVQTEIEAAAAAMPGWTPAHVEFFTPMIANYMKESGGDASFAAAAIHQGQQKLDQASAEAKLARQERNQPFHTQDPNKQFVSASTPQKKFTAKDLQDGTIVEAAMSAFESMQRGVRDI